MSFLRRLFGGDDEAGSSAVMPDDRQQVSVLLRLGDPELANEREAAVVYTLENRLMGALDASGAGMHETNELDRGYLRIQLLGPDAERIVEVVRPLLAEAPQGSYLAVRRGPDGTSEERLEI